MAPNPRVLSTRPALQGGVIHQVLQELRQRCRGCVHDGAHGKAKRSPNGEVAVQQHPQVDDRVGRLELPKDEHDKAQGGPGGQHPDERRGKPIRVLTFVEHHLQAPDSEGEQAGARALSKAAAFWSTVATKSRLRRPPRRLSLTPTGACGLVPLGEVLIGFQSSL